MHRQGLYKFSQINTEVASKQDSTGLIQKQCVDTNQGLQDAQFYKSWTLLKKNKKTCISKRNLDVRVGESNGESVNKVKHCNLVNKVLIKLYRILITRSKNK